MKYAIANGHYAHVVTDLSIGCYFVDVYGDAEGEDLILSLCKTFYYFNAAAEYVASLK